MKITGSLIQAYIICPRQAWLMSRQITGDQYNEFLAIGRLYSDETYKRDKKEIRIDGNVVDVVRGKDGELTLIEVKKSSKMLRASRMQLLHYLYSFSKKGHTVKGEIRIPKEKKVIPVEFNDAEKRELTMIYDKIEKLIERDSVPEKKRIGACRRCSYGEFCWS